MRTYLTERPEWVTFYPTFNSSFYIEKAGYFDERPEVHTSVTQLIVLFTLPVLVFYTLWGLVLFPFLFFGWGSLYIHLPIKTGIQDCESAAWGINIHDNTLWIYIGGGGNFEGGKKWITWYFPFLTKNWYRTSILLKDGSWKHEFQNERLGRENKCFWKDEWKERQASWNYDYIDSYDNSIIPTTIYVEEREWRPKWLQWTKLFAITNKTIDVHFSKEVGKRKGSWKGGTVGCSYTLLPNETPLDCLKRMEKERKF